MVLGYKRGLKRTDYKPAAFSRTAPCQTFSVVSKSGSVQQSYSGLEIDRGVDSNITSIYHLFILKKALKFIYIF